MKRKAEFLGIERKEVHGRTVDVKVFRSITEPSIDWNKLIDATMEAAPEELPVIREKIEDYMYNMDLWNDVEIERDLDDTIDHSVQSTMIKQDTEYDDDDHHLYDIPVDSDGNPLSVDEYLEGL